MNRNFIIQFLAVCTLFFGACNVSSNPKLQTERFHYDDGTLRMEIVYDVSTNNRILISKSTFYENGKAHEEKFFKNGRNEGPWRGWYDNGQPEFEGNLERGRETGKWTYWFPDGSTRQEGIYEDGEMHGAWTFWNENGSWEEIEFKEGTRSGFYRSYHANGQLHQEGQYRDGLMEGTWQTYSATGVLLNSNTYQNGQAI